MGVLMSELKYTATHNVRNLLESTGYWSGDSVFFNTSKSEFIITAENLDSATIRNIITAILTDKTNSGVTWLEAEIREDVQSYLKKTRAPDFCSMIRTHKPFQKRYPRVAILRRTVPKLSEESPFVATWKVIADWLIDHEPSEADRITLFCRIASDSFVSRECSTYTYNATKLRSLTSPYLNETLDNWHEENTSPTEIVSLLATIAKDTSFSIRNKKKQVPSSTIEFMKRNGVAITDGITYNQWRQFGGTCSMLLTHLFVRGYILFPNTFSAIQYLTPNDVFLKQSDQFWDESFWYDKKVSNDTRALAGRLLTSSTIKSPMDVPEDIHSILKSRYGYYSKQCDILLKNSLQKYAVRNNLPSFPLTKLNGLKAKKLTNTRRWTYEWCVEQGVPDDWLQVVKIVSNKKSNTVDNGIGYIRCLLEWAWLERQFNGPSDIKIEDIRDPSKPSRKDTFFSHVKSKNISKKAIIWQMASNCLDIVKTSVEGKLLLKDNPFKYHKKAPFANKHSSITHRRRLPNNIHEAMINVLLSIGDDGKPTYEWAKSVLKYDWINTVDPLTKATKNVFCPSRVNLLAFMLMIPLRKKQASLLDQGLMDQYIWDLDEQKYVENSHPLKTFEYPSGLKHLEYYGRPTGVLQPIYDDWYERDTLCMYINTNKTQMWAPEAKRGYELWWPTGDMLREGQDLPSITDQVKYLDRPYKIIEEQIRWMQQYDPFPEPITSADWTEEKTPTGVELPYFVPIFRDLSQDYFRNDGTKYFVPPTKNKIYYLLNALAVTVEEKLSKEYGINVLISQERNVKNMGNAYKGKESSFDVHSLRVFGVSYLIEIGVPWPVVQMIVGHQTPVMTLHYNKQTPEFVHQVLSSSIRSTNLFNDFPDIAQDVIKSSSRYISKNIGVGAEHIPDNILDTDFIGYVHRPGGICPVGGLECSRGQVSGENTNVTYIPTDGRCGNCRFFCTTPAHLFEHQKVINDLFIQIRSYGKQQTSIAESLKILKFTRNLTLAQELEKDDLADKLSAIEEEIEPMIREWANRVEMARQAIEQLDDFVEFVDSYKKQNGGKSATILLSKSTKDELEPRIQFHFEQAGEFELARQSMLGAHLSGGIAQCSELTRRQVRDFMNAIMAHDNPKQMLFSIPCESTRDKVAFLMAEAMASSVGSKTVQQAIDKNTGLKDVGVSEEEYEKLEHWHSKLFENAVKQGANASIESLMMSVQKATEERKILK